MKICLVGFIMDVESKTHFGLVLRPRTRGYHLTRENYASLTNRSSFGKNYIYIDALQSNDEKILRIFADVYSDSEGLIYTDKRCEKYLTEAMENFDLNMDFFRKLDRNKFDHEVDSFIKKTKFKQIADLRDCCYSGYYVMILDNYCQIYIGTSNNIKERIKQHWSGGKIRLDRLVCGSVNTSKLSIDSFRSLDTTRILVYKTKRTYSSEDEYIQYFSKDFRCNRVCGGLFSGDKPFSIDELDRYDFRSFE